MMSGFHHLGPVSSFLLTLPVWMETKRAIMVATYMIPTTDSIRLNEGAAGDAGVTSPNPPQDRSLR